MNKRSVIKKAVEKYIRILKLRDWNIEVREVDNPDNDEACEGCCSFDNRYENAAIQLARHLDYESNAGEKVIAHECCHVFLADMRQAFLRALECMPENTPKNIIKTLFDTYVDEEERVIRRVVDIISE